jgi:phenylpyruvate tautomerase PptA (4-oxalocrotonate tautomerase family)
VPHLQFEMNFTPSPEEKRRFATAVVRHFADVMDTGTDHIAVTLRCFAPEDLTFGRAAPSGGRTVFVDADIRTGRTRDQKRRLSLALHRRGRALVRGGARGRLRDPHRARRRALPTLRPRASLLVARRGSARRTLTGTPVTAPPRVLLTGPPGSGKTTVIRRVIDLLPGVPMAGFYTEEIRASTRRTGLRSRSSSRRPRSVSSCSTRSGRWNVSRPRSWRPRGGHSRRRWHSSGRSLSWAAASSRTPSARRSRASRSRRKP